MDVTEGHPTRTAQRNKLRNILIQRLISPTYPSKDRADREVFAVVSEGDETEGSFAQSSKSSAIASYSATDCESFINCAERRHFSAYMRKNRGLSIFPSVRARANWSVILASLPAAADR
jgi:hypothetical protein